MVQQHPERRKQFGTAAFDFTDTFLSVGPVEEISFAARTLYARVEWETTCTGNIERAIRAGREACC